MHEDLDVSWDRHMQVSIWHPLGVLCRYSVQNKILSTRSHCLDGTVRANATFASVIIAKKT